MIQHERTGIGKILDSSCSFLFPPVCHACETALDESINQKNFNDFCQTCLADLMHSGAPRCEFCSAIVGPHLDTSEGCVYCQSDKFSFKKVTTLGTYEKELKKAILRGKIGHDEVILRSLTRLLFESFTERITSAQANLIVPIPHHWRDRLFSRSLAANTIASSLEKTLKVPSATHLLKKVEHTAKQHQLSPAKRRKNLSSAFRVSNRFRLHGARIILVDDVFTTGTTCQRATRELLKAGAEAVFVIALARGIGA